MIGCYRRRVTRWRWAESGSWHAGCDGAHDRDHRDSRQTVQSRLPLRVVMSTLYQVILFAFCVHKYCWTHCFMYVLLDQSKVFEALLLRNLSLEEHDCINIKICTPESLELEWESLNTEQWETAFKNYSIQVLNRLLWDLVERVMTAERAVNVEICVYVYIMVCEWHEHEWALRDAEKEHWERAKGRLMCQRESIYWGEVFNNILLYYLIIYHVTQMAPIRATI